MSQTTTPQPSAESGTLHSPWWRLQGVFLEPTRTFQEIGQKPNWLIPMIALVLIGALSYSFMISTIGYENLVRQQMAANPRVQEMSQEQQEQAFQAATQSPIAQYFAYVAVVLFGTAGMALVALLFFLGMMLVAADLKYPQVLSVTLHSFFAYSLITSILTAIVIYLAPVKEEIDLQNVVQSNLGLLIDKTESPVLYSIGSSIDLFSIYVIYLLALGLSKAGKRVQFASALAIVLILWVIWVAGKAGIAALFS